MDRDAAMRKGTLYWKKLQKETTKLFPVSAYLVFHKLKGLFF